jgi:hypothetical protein
MHHYWELTQPLSMSVDRLIRICKILGLPELPVTANFVSSSLVLSILMTEAICTSETSVLTKAAQRYIPDHQKNSLALSPQANYTD